MEKEKMSRLEGAIMAKELQRREQIKSIKRLKKISVLLIVVILTLGLWFLLGEAEQKSNENAKVVHAGYKPVFPDLEVSVMRYAKTTKLTHDEILETPKPKEETDSKKVEASPKAKKSLKKGAVAKKKCVNATKDLKIYKDPEKKEIMDYVVKGARLYIFGVEEDSLIVQSDGKYGYIDQNDTDYEEQEELQKELEELQKEEEQKEEGEQQEGEQQEEEQQEEEQQEEEQQEEEQQEEEEQKEQKEKKKKIYVVVSNCNYVNFRKGPGTNYQIKKTVSFGTAYKILSKKNKWFYVKELKTKEKGYIFGKYLKKVSSKKEALKIQNRRKMQEKQLKQQMAERRRKAVKRIAENGKYFAGVKLQYQAEYQIASKPLNRRDGTKEFNGNHETYYSQKVLPGGGLKIPGRHVAEDGTIRDKDGYICVAAHKNYRAYGSILMTSLGPAKVYDTGCDHGTIDVYVNWTKYSNNACKKIPLAFVKMGKKVKVSK